jgi:hypothetical protein
LKRRDEPVYSASEARDVLVGIARGDYKQATAVAILAQVVLDLVDAVEALAVLEGFGE